MRKFARRSLTKCQACHATPQQHDSMSILVPQAPSGMADRGRKLTARQKQLVKLHGTPEEFDAAVNRAYADLFITMDEALLGKKAYKEAWIKAGRKDQ